MDIDVLFGMRASANGKFMTALVHYHALWVGTLTAGLGAGTTLLTRAGGGTLSSIGFGRRRRDVSFGLRQRTEALVAAGEQSHRQRAGDRCVLLRRAGAVRCDRGELCNQPQGRTLGLRP